MSDTLNLKNCCERCYERVKKVYHITFEEDNGSLTLSLCKDCSDITKHASSPSSWKDENDSSYAQIAQKIDSSSK